MPDPNFVLLYVDDPSASARFYADLFGKPALQSSPNFVMFGLDSGVMLGLWARHDVKPAANAAPGAGELCVSVADKASVDRSFADWRARGVRVVQDPVDLDFGRTFTALDPDGHRLRVFAPAAP